jgi:hypothetical protein
MDAVRDADVTSRPESKRSEFVLIQFLAIALAGNPAPASEPGSELFNIEPKPIVTRPFFLGGDEGADLGYRYVEAGFTTYDVDDFNNEKVDTYYGKLSWSLLKLFYVFGQYENSSTDFQNTDTNQAMIGGGAHLDGNETGYRVDGGVRWMVLPWMGGGIELDGGVGYIDLKNQLASSNYPTVYDLGARVHFLSAFSVGAMYEKIDVDDRFLGDVRFSF